MFISELIHVNESQIKAVLELLYLWYFAIHPALWEAKKLCGTGKHCIRLMYLQQQQKIWKSIHFSRCLAVCCCCFLNLTFLNNRSFQYWKWNLVLRSPEMQIPSTASSKHVSAHLWQFLKNWASQPQMSTRFPSLKKKKIFLLFLKITV